MKQLLAFLLALACVLCLIACDKKAGKDFDQPTGQRQFDATILEIHDAYFLVEPCAGTEERKSADKIEIATQNADATIAWQVGDLVHITYNGILLETYPARPHQVYRVEKSTSMPSDRETQPGGTSATEAFDIAVSYANWGEISEIYTQALNHDKLAMSSERHLPIYKFDTLAELVQFKNGVKDVLCIDAGYDEMPSFNEATAQYDAHFFEENTLMLVYVAASSGSHRYGVDSIACSGGSFCIHIKQINDPEAHTEDMAGWFITVAIPDTMVAECAAFDADFLY